MRDATRIFAGIVIIAIGIVFLLKVLGIWNFSVWNGFATYWPIGLILVGIALMLRMKWLALGFLLLTLFLGGVYLTQSIIGMIPADGNIGLVGDYRVITKEVPANVTADSVELNMGHGAGNVNINAGNSSLVKLVASTNDIKDPEFKYTQKDSEMSVEIERNWEFTGFRKQADNWDVELLPSAEYSMNLDYGAASMIIDLRGLKVNNIKISNGASSTKITFGNYPTKVKIDSGASSTELKFPKEMGVIVEVEGGAVGTDLLGFKKDNGRFINDAYNATGNNIEVEITAGASSVKGEVY
jgi:hypothetical protein